jgi:hypothetical protein
VNSGNLSCSAPPARAPFELWKKDEDIQLRVVTFLCEWWNVCNKVNAGESIADPKVVCSKVEKSLVEFLSLKRKEKPPKPPDVHKWEKPPDNHVKINFDGSCQCRSWWVGLYHP